MKKSKTIFWCSIVALSFLSFLLLSYRSFSYDASSKDLKRYLDALNIQFGRYGWKDLQPQKISWEYYRTTKNKNPLIFAHFGNSSKNCILFLGGVHGDELPSVYLMFKLAAYMEANPALLKDTCVVIAPLVNPDGFLSAIPTRTNSNGVDINRNFPTKDWAAQATRQWINKGRQARYFPGTKPASEQETLFQMALIKRYRPQKILSIHSPLNFFDYDGPSADLNSFEQWMEKICREANHPLKKFGFFPGSLGNYTGHEQNIFTLTLELPSSDPQNGTHYFQKFQPSIVKFINLPVAGSPPNIRMVHHARTAGAAR